MDKQISYFKNDIADNILKRVSQSITFKKSTNFPRIKLWNKFTAEIPSTQDFSAEFKKYYHSKVVDEIFQENLEEENVINNNSQLAKFYPIRTPGDGNCLCHAVSIYMWGIPDRNRFLRQILYIAMVTDEDNLLKRLYMQHVANLEFTMENCSTSILSKQWDILVTEAQEIPATSGSNQLEPLEAIHIFILANILCRPIVVLSSPVVRTVFNDTIQSDNIGGIYLPLLCNPDDTEKSPIVLGYYMNHFVPLLNMEDATQTKVVPLKRYELVNLPVHFFQDTLPNKICRKLNTYLKIDKTTESAVVGQFYLPKDQNIFRLHFEHCKALFYNMTPSVAVNAPLPENDLQPTKEEPYQKFVENHSETIHILASSLSKSPSFCVNNCGMYGSAELGNKCSQCFSKDTTVSAEPRPKIAVSNELYKPRYENVMGQINTKKSHQLTLKEVTPTAGKQDPLQAYKHLFPSHQQESHKTSVHDHKHKQFHLSHSDFQPAVFFGKKEPQIETALYRHISQHPGDVPEPTDLETATCVTPGCQMKAYRNMEYRCELCSQQKNYQVMGELRSKPVPKRHSPTSFNNHGQVWDYHIGKQHNQTPDLTSTNPTPNPNPNPNLVHRNESQTQLNTENNQVSLLELLCTSENCPNRRASLLESMCTSCLRKNGAFNCSMHGCSNKQGENLLAMCDDCFRNNELQKKNIQANRNTTTNYMPHTELSQTKQVTCDKTICINSGRPNASGYCLPCFKKMEQPESPQPSAPSFHG